MSLASASSLPRIALVGTGGTIAGAGVAEAGAPSAAYRAAVEAHLSGVPSQQA